jgi:magnesium chelatase accessory protein
MSDTLLWDKDGKDWPNREASQFVVVSGMRWHVQIAGQGPTLLLLHGTGASTHSWASMMPFLADHFTVIAPDLPGHGFTQTPATHRLSLKGMTQDVQRLLKHLDCQPQVIMGHSAGAAIATQIALGAPQKPKAVIGINAALMPFGGLAGQLFPLIARMLVLNPFVPRLFAWRASDPMAVERLISGTGSRISGQSLGFYRKLFASRSHVASTLGMMAQWSLDELISALPRMTSPLMLIVGENDKAVPPEDARKIKRLLPQTTIERIPHTGHLSHEERPEQVARLVLGWLSSLGAMEQAMPSVQRRAS